MKALIIDGSEKNDNYSKIVNDTVYKTLIEYYSLVTNVILYNHDVKGCIGDFGCFFKTPGKCIFNDLAKVIPSYYIESRLVAFITPVRFGGYSSLFAKAYNRIAIQLESHNFMYSKGEVHRKRRYNKIYPSLIVVGIEETKNMHNREVFKSLVERNAFHLFAPKHRVLFTNENFTSNNIKNQIQTMLSEIGENNVEG